MALTFRYDDPGAVDHPHYARYATITPGAPGRCPECDAFGYIDHADLTSGSQIQHCRGCGYRWEYCFDAEDRILEVRELPTPGRRPTTDTVLDLRSRAQPAARSGSHDDAHGVRGVVR